MVNFFKEDIRGHDLIISVPLYWKRFLKRGYNQSAILAKSISRRSNIKWNPNLLIRMTSEVSSQAGLNASQRSRNVKHAFYIHPKKQTCIKGKRILLIDDVLTTGSTVNACSQVLKNKGAEMITILTVAEVLKNDICS